jgi:PAS domain-containing protein
MATHSDLTTFLAELDSRRRRLAHLARSGSGELRDEVKAADEQLLTAQEELRVQDEELQAARLVAQLTSGDYDAEFADAPTAYLRTDRAGLVLDANAATRSLMTWPLLRWSRRPFVAQFTLPTRGTVRSMIGRAARHAGCVTGEATLRRPEDREIPVKLAAVASPFADVLRWAVIPVDAQP